MVKYDINKYVFLYYTYIFYVYIYIYIYIYTSILVICFNVHFVLYI